MKKLIHFSLLFLSVVIKVSAQRPYVIYENFEIRSSENMCLDPAIGKKYDLKNLVDGDLQTAWVFEEMIPEGTIKGKNKPPIFLYITFPSEVQIDTIQLSNGYLKSLFLYRVNNRTKTFRFNFSDNSEVSFKCKDTLGLQTIPVNKIIKSVSIEIVNWVDGDKYADHCISEIRILSNGENLLVPKGFRIENKAGWYSSDVVTFNKTNFIDMDTFNATNGLTDPLITKDRKFIMYHSNSDGCQIEIIDVQNKRMTDIGNYMYENKLCPQKWISNKELLVVKMNENYELKKEEYIFNIISKGLKRK